VVVFMGSPEFAIPTLKGLIQNFTVAGVVTQPDRPSGRGRGLRPPPVKRVAEDAGIPIIQPGRLSETAATEALRAWMPDVIVVAAFGQILKPAVLDLPPHGCINVHASLLPRWRGASPIQAAILAGDVETGVTIMRMDAGVDTGPILAQESALISPDDTGSSLSDRLAGLGADLLLEALPKYLSGSLSPQPQDSANASYSTLLKKADGVLDFQQEAEVLARQVRAYDPWPGSFLIWKGQPLKVHMAHAVLVRSPGPGVRTAIDGLPAIGTAAGILAIDLLQPAGKTSLPGMEFLKGRKDWVQEAAPATGTGVTG
jgi:methionyl-tRNA formyltransferase